MVYLPVDQTLIRKEASLQHGRLYCPVCKVNQFLDFHLRIAYPAYRCSGKIGRCFYKTRKEAHRICKSTYGAVKIDQRTDRHFPRFVEIKCKLKSRFTFGHM